MYYEQVKYIVYDIESVPDGQLIADVRYPDETLSPEEAIARYKQEISNNTDGRTDFIPATFQYPVSLAMALVDDSFLPVDIVVLDYPMGRALEITREFWQKVEHECNQPVLVTFNGRGFDVPLMELMAYKFGLPLKKHFNNKSGPRNRFGNQHIDLQDFLSNYGALRLAGGLNLLARLAGLPGKADVCGADVHDLYAKGQIEQIYAYCVQDVLDTYGVFVRSRVLAGEISTSRENEIRTALKAFLEINRERCPGFREYLSRLT